MAVDEMVLETQKWLNTTYGDVAGFGNVPESGHTGWPTVYGLIRGLQHELGIGGLVNNFGPGTISRWDAQFADKTVVGFKHNVVRIIQGGFWCKGISPEAFDGKFSSATAAAVEKLKKNAGIKDTSARVDSDILGALLTMDAFTLVSGGDAKIRTMQQTLNHDYQDYTGILPCDGIYQRETNTALIYAMQASAGIQPGYAGVYGQKTIDNTPTLTVGATSKFVRVLRWGLYVNNFKSALSSSGTASTSFDSALGTTVDQFRAFMALPEFPKATADLDVFMGVLISAGNTDRAASACDTSFQLNATRVQTLVDAGYDTVGRYLTGSVGSGSNERDKSLSSSEIKTITDGKMSIWPIYQDGASNEAAYFTNAKGLSDAKTALSAARNLGFPAGTVIYFAVDADIQTGDIAGTAGAYFAGVQDIIEGSEFIAGVYGTRNVASTVIEDGTASRAFVSDMSTGYSGNLGFAMPKSWAFDQFDEEEIGDFAIDKVGTTAFRSTAVKNFSQTQDSSDIYSATVKAANKFIQGCATDLPGFSPLQDVSFNETAMSVHISGGAADIDAKLNIGGSVSVPGVGVQFMYNVNKNKVTTNMDPYYQLLQNKTLPASAAQGAVDAISKHVGNGRVWVSPNLTGNGFTLHMYNDAKQDTDGHEVTVNFEVLVSISFHPIDVAVPTPEVVTYNNATDELKEKNWNLPLIGTLAVAFIGTVALGILIVSVPEIGAVLLKAMGSLMALASA